MLKLKLIWQNLFCNKKWEIWRCCWCWQNAIKYKTWFTLLSHSQLMTRFPPSIHRLYKPLFKGWCCSPEIVNVLLPPFWDLRMPYWSIPVFYYWQRTYLPPHLSTSISTSLFFLRSIRILMILTASKTPQIL